MSSHDDFGWRDRAIALASLGAAALSRLAFGPAESVDPQPLDMAATGILPIDQGGRAGTLKLPLG
jgi:hypothetical protein